MIPLSVPHIKGNEWKYIKDCLDSGWVSSVGGYVTKFEDAVKNYLGRAHAIACINGTTALHMSLLASGVGHNDEVIMPALTFIAPANAIRYVGAYPVFMDVDEQFWQMDLNKMREFLSEACEMTKEGLMNRTSGRRIKAIMPVDLLGHPCDMDTIMDLAKQYGLTVIEDNAESLGSKYKDRPTGAIANVTCLSFNGNKIITTGGGGMIVTNDTTLANRLRYLSTQAKDDEIEYIHHEVGYNARLTNMQAAMGLAQMEVLDTYVDSKRMVAHRYAEGLKGIPGIHLPTEAKWAHSSFWLYTILIDDNIYGKSSRAVLKHLHEQKIQARPVWHTIPELKPFCNCVFYKGNVAPRIYKQALSLPSSVALSVEDQDRVVEALRQ